MTKSCLKPAGITGIAGIGIIKKGWKKVTGIAGIAGIKNKAVLSLKKVAGIAGIGIIEKGWKKVTGIAGITGITIKAFLSVKKVAGITGIAGKKWQFRQFRQKKHICLYISPLLFCARKEERETCRNCRNST